MSAEDQIVGAVLDALGLSSGARAAERKRAEDYYNEAYRNQQEGKTLKESGFDPKVVGQTLGPDYQAHLEGYEKGDAFKQAVQARQFNEQLKAGLRNFVTAPGTETYPDTPTPTPMDFGANQTPASGGALDYGPAPGMGMPRVPAGQNVGAYMRGREAAPTPGSGEDLVGFLPHLQGPGISPAAEVATANLTRPGFETMQSRIESLKPQTAAILYGAPVAAAGTAGKRLEQVEIPGVAQENERIGVAKRGAAVSERNAAVNEGTLGLQTQAQQIAEHQTRVENVRKRRTSRTTAIANAQRVVAVTHPWLTGEQARKLSRYYADEGTGQGVTDIPGDPTHGRGTGTGAGTLGAKAAYARLNTIADRIPNEVVPNAQKARRVPDQTELDGANDAALREFTTAAADYLAQSGIQPNPGTIADLASKRATFAVRRGSKIVAVPWAELKPKEREAKVAIIEQVMSGAVGGTGAGKAYLDNLFGTQAAPAAPAQPTAPSAGPTAVPTPAAQPMSIVPGGGSVPGITYPVQTGGVPQMGGLPAGISGGGSIGTMPGARRFERLIPRR